MREIDKILDNYYSNIYSEDERLIKDNVHKMEFITTINYIDKYLEPNDRILEIGAGTGRYSLYYANKGYKVDAVELVKSNVDKLKSNITKDMDINAIQGNALDLSMYKDDTFDITLVLGPLYHLFSKEDVDKAINEAIRVTKPDGIIYLAFILFDMSILSWGFIDKNIYDNYGKDKQVSLDFKPNNDEKLVFNLRFYDDIKKLMNNYDVEQLHYVATDGIARLIKDTVNNMTEEEYKLFLDYHLSFCERDDLMGYSGHILSINKKRKR